MKRLCIFVTYDIENIVDDYIGYMLCEIKKISDYLVVVCNYKYIIKGIENVQPFADKVIYRENKGFDAGAYKEVFCHYLSWDEVCNYEEILLVNDSFYGPFYSLQKLFYNMEAVNVDYWGLTRSPKGRLACGHMFTSHVQSYFLAIRKKVFLDHGFRIFWENMDFPLSITRATIIFEFGINEFFNKNAYVGTTIMDLYLNNLIINENENPYLVYPLELIRDAGIPILKRKSISLRNRCFDNVVRALEFIKDECNYKMDLMTNHLSRIGQRNNVMALDKFYDMHTKIFIYGAGMYGKNLAKYFEYKNWVFEKYLVTNIKKNSNNCVSFDEACISINDGIIIAVGDEKVFEEILRLVEQRCNRDQIFNYNGIIQ